MTSRGGLNSERFAGLARGNYQKEEPWLVTHSHDKNGAEQGKNSLCTNPREFLVTQTLLFHFQ